MSTLSALDAMVLRETVYPPLTTKSSELTFAEWDQRVIDMYAAIQDIVSGGNVEAYNPATIYDSTSSDPYLKFAGYNSRIWQAVFAGTFSGQTPAEGVYWTQITLAQMLPNVLKLVEVGNGTSQAVKTAKLTVATADVLTGFATPIPFGLTVPAGYYVQPLSVQFGVDFNTVAYATNTGVAIRAVGADTYIAAHATALAATLSRVANLSINNSPSAGQTQYIDGADIEFFVQTGNPTAGDSNVDVYMTYILVEL